MAASSDRNKSPSMESGLEKHGATEVTERPTGLYGLYAHPRTQVRSAIDTPSFPTHSYVRL